MLLHPMQSRQCQEGAGCRTRCSMRGNCKFPSWTGPTLQWNSRLFIQWPHVTRSSVLPTHSLWKVKFVLLRDLWHDTRLIHVFPLILSPWGSRNVCVSEDPFDPDCWLDFTRRFVCVFVAFHFHSPTSECQRKALIPWAELPTFITKSFWSRHTITLSLWS